VGEGEGGDEGEGEGDDEGEGEGELAAFGGEGIGGAGGALVVAIQVEEALQRLSSITQRVTAPGNFASV
jgi:hypothetical protein